MTTLPDDESVEEWLRGKAKCGCSCSERAEEAANTIRALKDQCEFSREQADNYVVAYNETATAHNELVKELEAAESRIDALTLDLENVRNLQKLAIDLLGPIEESDHRFRDRAVAAESQVTAPTKERDEAQNEVSRLATKLGETANRKLVAEADRDKARAQVTDLETKLAAMLQAVNLLSTDVSSKPYCSRCDTYGHRHEADCEVGQALSNLPERSKLITDVVEATKLLIEKGLRNNGEVLYVIEHADKSDPHYRLCTALESLSALTKTSNDGERG